MAVAEPFLVPVLTRRRRRTRSVFAGSTPGAYVAFAALAAVLVVTVWAKQLAPFDPNLPVGDPFTGPGLHHLLGTDEIGRDI